MLKLLIGGTLSVARLGDTWTVDADVPDELLAVEATPVDDQAARLGLELLLDGLPDIEVLGIAANGQKALDL